MKTVDPLDESLHEFISSAPSLNELAKHLKAVSAQAKQNKERKTLDECKDFLNELRPQMMEAAKNGKTRLYISSHVVFPDGFTNFCHSLGFSVQDDFGRSIVW